MILTKNVNIRWTKQNRNHYEDKGYIFTSYNDTFEVKVEDLLPNSTAKVLVQCDYCNEKKEKAYSLYYKSVNRSEIKKYACKNCSIKKQKANNKLKYGREDALGYFEELREKRKEFRRNYYKEKKDG
jgi:hypothetical protein